MRIIHTADWHLGHTLHGISREIEHQAFLDWLLIQLADNIDGLIVAGDIFDGSNPSASAQSQLYDFIVSAKQQNPQLDIILLAGNHDSANRLDAIKSLCLTLGVTVVGGLPRQSGDVVWQSLCIPIHNQQHQIEAWCGVMPFLRQAELPVLEEDDRLIAGVRDCYQQLFQALQQQATAGQALLMTGHCYMQSGRLSELSERKILGGNLHALPLDIFPDEVAYVALGHLHLAQAVGDSRHIRYSGSPLPLSLDEANYSHQVVVVNIEQTAVSTSALLVPRHVDIIRIPRQGAASLDDVLLQLQQLELDPKLESSQWPFLSIDVMLSRPEPSLRQQCEALLENKSVRLLKLNVSYQSSGYVLAENSPISDLKTLDPEWVFRACYQQKYKTEPESALISAFHELLEALPESI